LTNHLNTNFQLIQHHGYSLWELEGMIPWERTIYCYLVSEHVKEENKRAKKEQAEMRAASAKARR